MHLASTHREWGHVRYEAGLRGLRGFRGRGLIEGFHGQKFQDLELDLSRSKSCRVIVADRKAKKKQKKSFVIMLLIVVRQSPSQSNNNNF